jgi:DNA polymerase III delta' subunit
MPLKNVFCQEKAVASLEQAYDSGKVAHAYIFAGPDGVGKFTTAREFAKLLLCKNPVKIGDFTDSCGVCESCRAFDAGSHPDFEHVYKELLEFTKDNKDRKNPVDLAIDVIREFLVEKVSARPSLSSRRVFIVSEAEKLNAGSQNALLKVLEEPPTYCSIFLLCTQLENLLPTTKSRCQVVRFAPVGEDRIIEKLNEMGIKDQQAKYLARLSQGSIGQACQWGRLELNGADVYEAKKQITKGLSDYKYADSLRLAENFLQMGKKIASVWADLDQQTSKSDINRRALKTLIMMVIAVLHDAMISRLKPKAELVNFDQKDCIDLTAGRLGVEPTAAKIAVCYEAMVKLDSNVNEKLIYEQLLLNIANSDIIAP